MLTSILDKIKPLINEIKSDELLSKILIAYDDLNSPECEFHKDNPRAVLIGDAPAGVKHHHTEPGGYLRHLKDMYNLAEALFQLAFGQEYDFTMEDVCVVILLHDLSKAKAFEWLHDNKNETNHAEYFLYRKDFFKSLGYDHETAFLLLRYEIPVTRKQYIAIMHAEGGWSDAAKNGYQGNKLSKFVHVLDLFSSQLLG